MIEDKTVELMRKDRAFKIEGAKAITDAAKAEDRDITEEETAQVDTLLDEAEAYVPQIAKAEAEEARALRLATAVTDLSQAVGSRVEPDAIVQPGAGVTVGATLWENDPKLGFPTFGHFCRSVKGACRPGSMVDERLMKIVAAYGANTASGEEGGFLVPPEYSNRIYERTGELLPILEQCDRLTITGNSITINGMVDHAKNATTYRYAGLVVYWVAEAGAITRSNLKFRQINLRLNKLAALSYVTEEELSDANISFGPRLISKMAAGIAEETVEAVMFGTGVGQPLGAFASTACISTAKESGQAADTIVFENIINMTADLWPQSSANAKWYYNGEALPQLATMVLEVGAGGVPVYLAGGAATAMPASLWGRPAYPTEHCEALGDAGDIVLGDFAQYLLATKGTVKTAMSIHLRFVYDEVAFKSTFRIDGRPAWEQSLRPRKGASAKRLSPWVKLAARA